MHAGGKGHLPDLLRHTRNLQRTLDFANNNIGIPRRPGDVDDDQGDVVLLGYRSSLPGAAGHAALIGRIRSEEMYAQVLSAFQATPRKTIIAESSIHTIKPIAAASPP
jgi:hypothetical protein